MQLLFIRIQYCGLTTAREMTQICLEPKILATIDGDAEGMNHVRELTHSSLSEVFQPTETIASTAGARRLGALAAVATRRRLSLARGG